MAITTTADLLSDQAAYNRLAYFALRPLLHFDQVAEVKPTAQPMPGASVVFTKYADLAVATTPLSETVDVTPATMSDTQVTVTLVEYGNAASTTAKLRGTSFLSPDQDAANIVGFNAGLSQDTIARDVIAAGTNVRYAGAATSRVTVAAGHTLAAANVRRARTDLVKASCMSWPDGFYRAHIHPDVAYDLRTETGEAAWRQPQLYTDANVIKVLNGEVGSFEGFRFIETERGPLFADAGVGGTVDVYATLFTGRQALAKAFSSSVSADTAQVVIGPVVDILKRLHPIGWYWLGGYGRFREECIRRVESSSSIGAN